MAVLPITTHTPVTEPGFVMMIGPCLELLYQQESFNNCLSTHTGIVHEEAWGAHQQWQAAAGAVWETVAVCCELYCVIVVRCAAHCHICQLVA
jgi:hypothetical protein